MENLLDYKNFKKINEEFQDLSNNTAWNDTLLGKAFGGILKFFKKGIAMGKLALYKQNLINEYLAGVLRGLKDSGMIFQDDKGNWVLDLKKEPKDPGGGGGGGGSTPKIVLDHIPEHIRKQYETIITLIENTDPSVSGNTEVLKNIKADLQKELDGDGTPGTSYKEMLNDLVVLINNQKKIVMMYTKDPTIQAKHKVTLDSLNKRKIELEQCQLLINTLIGEIDKKLTTTITSSYSYDGYDMLNEASLSRVLGDTIDDMGTLDMKLIDTTGLTIFFQDNKDMIETCTSRVNMNSVKAIDVAAVNACLIKSRGNENADTKLTAIWSKYKEEAKGMFKNFLDVSKIDPSNGPDKVTGGDSTKFTKRADEAALIAKAGDVGLDIKIKPTHNDNRGVMRFGYGNDVTGTILFNNILIKSIKVCYFMRTIDDLSEVIDKIKDNKYDHKQNRDDNVMNFLHVSPADKLKTLNGKHQNVVYICTAKSTLQSGTMGDFQNNKKTFLLYLYTDLTDIGSRWDDVKDGKIPYIIGIYNNSNKRIEELTNSTNLKQCAFDLPICSIFYVTKPDKFDISKVHSSDIDASILNDAIKKIDKA